MIPWPSATPPIQLADEAGLRYIEEDEPGIVRRPCGRGFTYIRPDGETLRDAEERERIEALAIPPAWSDVWVCTYPEGHVLATGRDDRGRKQYRYHPRWEEARDRAKFGRVLAFGAALPALRNLVGRRLGRDDVPSERMIAAAVRLLDRTGIRVGHAEYAEQNGTVGLTTLQGRHLRLSGPRIELEFVGKGGAEIHTAVEDPRLARVLEDFKGRPGDRIFRRDTGDGPRGLDADDLNEWLRDALHPTCSAKDFRTWRATVAVISDLAEADRPPAADRTGRYLEAVDRAADHLSNTRTVLRSSYLPPGLEDLYVDGPFPRLLRRARAKAADDRTPGRTAAERLAVPVLAGLLARNARSEK